MPVRKIKGTTPGRRNMSTLTHEEVSLVAPKKSLVRGKKQKAGRSGGSISIRHRGGGAKRKLRNIDFKRSDKLNIEASVKSVEYDPNRSAYIMLVCYTDGEYRYHLAPQGVKVGDKILTSLRAKARRGNRMPLENIPVGFEIYNVQINPSGAGQTAKAAGAYAKLVSLDGEYAQVQLPSGEVRFVHKGNFASIGRVSNIDHGNVRIGKAGRTRWKGRRPQVRGKAMNPVDHPHGGGEGGSPIGMKYPKTKWGMHALGVKTRKRKCSNRWIVKTRKGKTLAKLNS